MVDATTLTLLATFVQTSVITLTLLVFIFQFRSQEKATRESSYQNLLGRYNDYVMAGSNADNLLLARLFSADAEKVSSEELTAVRRLMVAYGIIEEAYGLYDKGWIDKETWEQWAAWLRVISKHPQFSTLHAASTGMFDKGYQDYVSRMIESNSSAQKR